MKPAAIGIVFDESKEQVLIVRRKDVPVWVLPGGGVDEGEAAQDAVCREVFEETGCTVQVVRQVGNYTPINRLTAPAKTYVCRIVAGTPSLSDETDAVGFYPINKLPRNFFPLYEKWLKDALLGSSEVIQAPIREITYWTLIVTALRHPLLLSAYLFTRFFRKE